MTLDATLLRIVVCPDCRAALAETSTDGVDELACTRCDLVYPIRSGIPVLLVDEARRAG